MHLEKLQQAWQSQSYDAIGTDPEPLLSVVRLQRRAHFWVDIAIVTFFSCLGAWFLVSTLRDIQREWPWFFYSTGLFWVVGFILFNRWRRRRKASHYDESMLAHVEKSIDDIQYQMWLDRNNPWWYTLPIMLGCMIPPVFFLAMNFGKGAFSSLVGFLTIEAVFGVCFIFIYRVMKFAGRSALKENLRQLEALRALRESLLHLDEELM